MRGRIIKGVGGLYTILDGEKRINARARGIFRKNSITPLPGDMVDYEVHLDEASIDGIVERKNSLIRPAIANVTQALIVFALKNPDINFELLNIFLVILEKKQIKPIILFNKADIADEETKNKLESIFKMTPYEFYFISAKNDDIKDLIYPLLKDEVSVLMGPSGAGKSSLLNAIVGEERMFTGEVSQKIGRGKHTTRHTELIEVAGGLVADTPGFSSMELIDIQSDELKYLMPEFLPYNNECKFADCSHMKEPGCAVKNHKEVTISPQRYEFYYKSMEKLKEGEKRKWQ